MSADSDSSARAAVDIVAITNLLGTYCHLVDTEPIEQVLELFWPDATLIAPDGSRHDGHAAIRDWCRHWDDTMRRPVTELRHRISVPAITLAGDRATALTYMDADCVAGDRLIAIRGRYIDRLGRRDGEWRFGQRQIETWTQPRQQVHGPA